MRMRRLMLLLALGVLLLPACGRSHKLRIAAGRQGSGVYRMGTAIADVVTKHVDGTRASVVEGSHMRDSVQKVVEGKAELAIAFSDSPGDGDVRTLVPLYELYLYIIVWEDGGITDIPSMKGHKVGLGPQGGGTDGVARRLLKHYNLASDDLQLINGGYRDESKKFLKRELDAVFILGSIESKAVDRMLKAPGAKLLSLDDPTRVAPVMDGIRSKQPFVVSHIIPKHLFGNKPSSPTGVIGVHALLVAGATVSEADAREVTRAVFAHKVELGRKVPRLRELSERFTPHTLRFPLHPGASQYYRRDEPPAILEWADTISLIITVMLLSWSGIMAIAARRKSQRKDFLATFYQDFQAIVGTYDEAHETPPDEMDDEQLQEVRDKLQLLRRRAFDALMGGTVEADSAFVVFHDYLRWELQAIERIQQDRRRDAGLGIHSLPGRLARRVAPGDDAWVDSDAPPDSTPDLDPEPKEA